MNDRELVLVWGTLKLLFRSLTGIGYGPIVFFMLEIGGVFLGNCITHYPKVKNCQHPHIMFTLFELLFLTGTSAKHLNPNDTKRNIITILLGRQI